MQYIRPSARLNHIANQFYSSDVDNISKIDENIFDLGIGLAQNKSLRLSRGNIYENRYPAHFYAYITNDWNIFSKGMCLIKKVVLLSNWLSIYMRFIGKTMSL